MPVKLAEQVAVPAVVPAANVHGLPVNEPVTPVCVKLTVPVGVITMLTEESATVAVQFVAWFTVTVEGEQTTVTDVDLRVTITVVVPVLPL